jgi:hypothetical protein
VDNGVALAVVEYGREIWKGLGRVELSDEDGYQY